MVRSQGVFLFTVSACGMMAGRVMKKPRRERPGGGEALANFLTSWDKKPADCACRRVPVKLKIQRPSNDARDDHPLGGHCAGVFD
jgi:hypothetical protein